MEDSVNKETDLLTDSYDSIAFKGQSAQYLSGVLAEVTQMAERGPIYPPSFATSWDNSRLENGLTPQQLHQDDGRLTPAEAVAIRVLAEEGSALAQNLCKSPKKTKLIETITDDSDGVPLEIVAGMADFGYNLLRAARLRESITKEESAPLETKTIGDHIVKELWKNFENPLNLDGLSINQHTVNAADVLANEAVEGQIHNEEPDDKKFLPARIKSRRLGIKLGARIYQQVFSIAVQKGLSTKLEKLVSAR